MALRVILTTGGTGGHIFPALSTAEALKKRLPDVEILFVGGLYGPEGTLARKHGLPFAGLPVRGMLGRGLKMIPAAWAMLRGVVRAWRLVRAFKPDVVMGFGGYAAFATVLAAWLCGLPTGIHEQNAIPGAANRLLGKLVRVICLSLPDLAQAFPSGRTVMTGNPIRADIAALNPADNTPEETGDLLMAGRKRAFAPDLKQSDGVPSLLIMGGSQGALALNSLGISLLAALRDAGARVLHQTGPRDLERVRAAYIAHGFSPESAEDAVVPFIDDMAAAYRSADLALCRSGATTLAELAATGTPAVLVPFPHAAHDHQTMNARAAENAGAAVLIPESELAGRDMAALVLALLRNPEKLDAMGRAARSLAKPQAAAAVADEIIRLATLRTA